MIYRPGIQTSSETMRSCHRRLVSSSEVSLLSQSQPQEAAVFDHYAPRIGPLQMGASLLLAALGFWAIILLAR